MPRRRTYSRNEKKHNYSWQSFYQAVSNPTAGETFLIYESEPFDFDTVVQRQLGAMWLGGPGDETGMAIASIVLPANMTAHTPGQRITETNFPDPLDDETDDWSLWQPLFAGSDQGSPQANWDSKSKRVVQKDEKLYVCARYVFTSGATISNRFLGRMLVSWRN